MDSNVELCFWNATTVSVSFNMANLFVMKPPEILVSEKDAEALRKREIFKKWSVVYKELKVLIENDGTIWRYLLKVAGFDRLMKI